MLGQALISFLLGISFIFLEGGDFREDLDFLGESRLKILIWVFFFI